jgi:hypothetical protein
MKKSMFITVCFAITQIAIAHADTVSLNYKWEPGIIAKVYYKAVRTKQYEEKIEKREIKGSYTLSTKSHEKGLRLDVTDSKSKVSSTNAEEENKLQEFMQKLTEKLPSCIIDSKGNLIEVVEIAKFRQDMLKELDSWLSESTSEEGEKATQLVKTILSDQQLLSIMQKSWNRDVAQWIGAEFETGYVYDIEFSTPVAFLNNIQIPTKGRYEYLGKVKCRESDQTESCVELSFKSALDEKTMEVLMVKLFEKIGKEPPEGFVVKIDTEVILTTEPQTLFPHKMMQTGITTIPIEGKSTPAVLTDIREMYFTYNNEPQREH